MTRRRIAAVVLAGGDGTRLGAAVPKPLVTVGGRPMIAHVLARVPATVAPVLVSANDGPAFASLGLPVVADRFPDRKGPLAGLDAAAAWLRAGDPAVTHLLTLPGDTPFLPGDVVERVTSAIGDRPRIVRFRNGLQPSVALWPLNRLDTLAAALEGDGDRSLLGLARRAAGFDVVDFEPSAEAPGGDPFFNVNTPEELAIARAFFAA